VSDLLRIAALPADQRRPLAGCVLLLPLTRLGLSILGLRRVRGLMARHLPTPADAAVDAARAADLARVARIARHRGVVKASCLEESLVLWWLLRRRAMPARLRIGVRKNGAVLQAHAWVEIHGRPLNDANGLRKTYASFDRDLDSVLPTTR
jgi:hypothetical protein